MRINKYIAAAGICSRRKADELISNGNVKINGAVVKTLGYDVGEDDRVTVNGKTIEVQDKKVYIAVNKPVHCITSMNDERGRFTVKDLVEGIPERIFPVGRLDFDTTGLIIMTNDGDVSQRISHPKNEIYKTYMVKVKGILSGKAKKMLSEGVKIDDVITSPAKVTVVKQTPKYALVEIKIREGRNRQIRKMFSAVGNDVEELERTAIGEIKLGRLMRGHYRKLKRVEVEYLKSL